VKSRRGSSTTAATSLKCGKRGSLYLPNFSMIPFPPPTKSRPIPSGTRTRCAARRWRRLTLAGLLILLLTGADEPEIVRVRVPAREVSRWFPAGTELRLMPAKQFESLLKDAIEGSSRQRRAHPPRLIRARHQARFGSGALMGHTELVVEAASSGPSDFVLDPWTPAIIPASSSVTVVGARDSGKPSLWVDEAPHQTIALDWELQPRSYSRGRSFTLDLPGDETTVLTLEIPKNWVTAFRRGQRPRSRPAADPDRQVWEIEAESGRLEVRLYVPEPGESLVASNVWISGSTQIDLRKSTNREGGLVNWTTDWTVDLDPHNPQPLVFALDPDLELIDVQGAAVRGFSLKRPGTGTQLIVNLSEDLKSSTGLKILAHAKVPSEGEWKIPSIQPLDAVWTGGRTTVILDDFHVVQDYRETSGRRIFPAEGDARPINQLVLESSSPGSVGQLVFRRPRAESSCVVRGQLFVSGTPCRLECQLDWEFHQGSTSELEIDLNREWVPERVQIRGRNERVKWHRSVLPSGDSRLYVSLDSTAQPRKNLRLVVTACSTKAGIQGPLELPRVRPVDARIADESWLAWVDQGTIIQPSLARGLAWIDPTEMAGLVTPPLPGSNMREALAWRWIADSAAARLDREPIEQEPGATIRATAKVDKLGRRLILEGSLTVSASALSLDSIPIWIDQPNDGVTNWRIDDESSGQTPEFVPIDQRARSKWCFPDHGSAWNLQMKVASQTRKTVRFHRELAWNSGGSIPLFAVSPRFLFRGMISVEAPLDVRCRVKTVGLRRLDNSAFDQPKVEPDQDVLEVGREERTQTTSIHTYSFTYDRPGGHLELATEPLARLQQAGIIREAVLTTTVAENGPLLNRLRLLVHSGDASSLDLAMPEQFSLLHVRRDGADVAPIRSGPNVSIPLPWSSQGPKATTIVIDYWVEKGTIRDGKKIRPDVPVIELPCLSFAWEVIAPGGWQAVDCGPGWLLSEQQSSAFWPSEALGIWKPAWDFLRAKRRPDAEQLARVLDDRLADPDSAALTFAEVFSRWDSGPPAILIDRVSLNSARVAPRSPCVPSRSKPDGRHVSVTTLEHYGLALVSFPDAFVITSAADLPEFEHHERWTAAITEALAWGYDRTDRFQSVARWRGEPSPRNSSSAAAETGERIKHLEGWSTWRFAGTSWPDKSMFVYAIDVNTRIVAGWIVVGSLLLVWPWRRGRLERRVVLLATAMAGSLVFDWLLPTRFSSFTAAVFVGSLCILMIELGSAVARPSGEGRIGGRTESSLVRRVAGTAVAALLAWLLVGRIALAQPAAGPNRGSAILALFPYEGALDPTGSPTDVILRLSDFERLSRMAEAKVATESTSVRAVSVLHRVKKKSARDVVVDSELELIAAGQAPFVWRVPVSQARDIAARLDGDRAFIAIEPGGETGTLVIPKPGRHLLQIHRSAVTRVESGYEALRMHVNAMPSARVIVEPGGDSKNRVEVTAYGLVRSEVDQTFAGWLGPVDKLEVRWPLSGPPVARRAAGVVEGLILWDITPAGDRILARLTHRQPQNFTAVRLRHQRGLILRSARVRGSAEPLWAENAGNQEWVLHVDPPLEEGGTIELDCWMPLLGARGGDRNVQGIGVLAETVRQLPELQPIGAERYAGSLGVRRPGDWTGRFDAPAGTDPISDESFVKSWGNPPAEPLTLCGTSRFVGDCRASIPTGPVPARIVVKPTVGLQLESGRVVMAVEAELSENAGHLQRLEARLPDDLQINEITAEGLANWTVTPDRRLRLMFDHPVASPRRRLHLSAWIPLTEDPLKIGSRHHRIRIPWIAWEGSEGQTGFLAISSMSKPEVVGSPGLILISSESSGAGGAVPPRHRRTYRVDDVERIGEVVWESLPARVSVSIESQVTIHPDTAEWAAVLRYDVVGGSLDAIHLKMPAAWSASAELRLADSEYQLTTETRGLSAFWTITPQRPVRGSQRFVLRSSRPLGSDRELVYPELSPLGRGAVNATLQVVNAIGRPLTIENPVGLERIASEDKFLAREFAIDVGIPIGAFRVSGDSWVLRVQLPRVVSDASDSRGGGARLAIAELMIHTVKDRSNVGQAVYETVAGTGSELSLRLPSESSILWATVDSNPVTPLRSASGTLSIPLDDSRQSRVGLIWRSPAASATGSRWTVDLPRAGSQPVTTLIAVYTPTPVLIQGDPGGPEVVSAARFEIARAEWLTRSIEDFATKFDRSSGRDHEKLVALLISHELALRAAERFNQKNDPAAKTAQDHAERNRELIHAARAAPVELVRRARLDDDFTAAKRYLGEKLDDTVRPSAGVREPSASDRIRAFGHPTALLGVLPGIGEPSKGTTMTLESRSSDEASQSLPGRAIALIALLLMIAFFATNRFRGFRINLLALLATILLAAFTGGPLVLAGGLGLAAAAWKKARG
jgi:hypothetical protein